MKKLVLAILMTFVAVTAHAESWLQFEGAIGNSHYTGSGSGTYYEDGVNFPHVLNFTRVGYEVGVTGPIMQRGNWGVDWHADYVYLGRESFDGMVDSNDANYNPSTGGCNGPCAPTEHMWGGGSVRGIDFPLEPYYTYRGIRFSALVGPFVYRPTMSMSYTAPSGITYSYNSPDNIRISLMYGAQISYKNVFIRYEHFTDRSSGGVVDPGIQTSTNMLSLGYRF